MRVIIAGILGGIVMFAWGAFSHMVLNIESDSMKPMPNEAAVAAAMKANIPEAGLYFVPGVNMTRTLTAEEQAAWAAKYKEGPTAMIVYHPTGDDVFTPRQFGTQFGSDLVAAMIGAVILMFAAGGFTRGVLISILIGAAAWVSISVPYWNWYKFPTEFIKGELLDQIGAWFFAGLVMAFVLRKRN